MKTVNSKRGITLMELMVVLAIMSILSTVAMPKMFGAGEKAREKIDLMKLYDLRNSLNLALIEDSDAMTHYEPSKKQNADKKTELLNKLNTGLSSDQGAALFVIELHNSLSINVQGSHNKLSNKNVNICEMIGEGGTFYTALKEANFDGVADIVADRLRNDGSHKQSSDTYVSTPYTNANGGTDYRTAPRRAIFQSKALTKGKIKDNTRYTVSIRWSDVYNPGYSVEVYIVPNEGKWNSAYMSDFGTCFSTYGRKGCSKSK